MPVGDSLLENKLFPFPCKEWVVSFRIHVLSNAAYLTISPYGPNPDVIVGAHLVRPYPAILLENLLKILQEDGTLTYQ
jgi:hypothetical protein